MQAIATVAQTFLGQRRIAVTGVSRSPDGHGSNLVYTRLRERGYDVFAVNPNAETVEDDPAFPDLAAIPGGVDAVVIATSPDHALATMQECARLGINLVWMHKSIGGGSVSDEATEYGRSAGLTVIDGGCPLMFKPVDDFGHQIMKRVLTVTGAVPRSV